MRLDANKIEERIEKLQQLKKIAADPELVRMLFEFMDMGEETVNGFSKAAQPAKVEANRGASRPDEASELISRMVRSVSGG
jgi:hypothetical protein